MARTSSIRRTFVTGSGASTLFLGLSLFVLASVMANPAFDTICYAIAVILVASSLLLNSVYHLAKAGKEQSGSSTAVYFIASSFSVACGFIFWLIQSGSSDIRILQLLAGFQGLFWSMWYIRLAFRIQASARKGAMLCTLAATTSFLGIVIAAQSHVSTVASVTEVACYTAFTGVQILLTAVYLFRECDVTEQCHSEASAVAQAVDTPADSTVLLLQ